jgi:thioredoxin-dependent peroxiredoxin
MSIQIGSTAPDFEAETTDGTIGFHEWIGDSWAVLFSHPKDFTPVCTTELGYMARIIGLSVDPVEKHGAWSDDIEETQGTRPNYPLIGDADFTVSKLYGMLGADVSGDPGDRTAADNQAVRNVFVIGPDKKVKLILVYPMTTGRNFDEVVRVIDSLQLTASHKVATPVNWQQGEDVIIAGSVSNDEARELFGEWESPKPYIRIVRSTHGGPGGRAPGPRKRSSRRGRSSLRGRPSGRAPPCFASRATSTTRGATSASASGRATRSFAPGRPRRSSRSTWRAFFSTSASSSRARSA